MVLHAAAAAHHLVVAVAGWGDNNMSLHQIKTHRCIAVACCLLISLLAFAEPVELKLPDGTVWLGETGQRVSLLEKRGRRTKQIEGTLVRNAGSFILLSTATGDKVPVFLTNIISIETQGGELDSNQLVDEQIKFDSTKILGGDTTLKPKPQFGKLPKGVFVLPLDGGIGDIIRPTEIRAIAEHADEFGPGQIIILDINSPGGDVLVGLQLRDAVYEIRERHRIIAWVDMAISGGAFLAMCCDEIYFKSNTKLGSITAFSQGVSLQGAQRAAWITQLESVLAKSSRSIYFAKPMVTHPGQLSYSKDSETGEITYFPTTEGDVILSDGDRDPMLDLYVVDGIDSNFADGLADTHEELAELLDLEQWLEIDPYGRNLSRKWKETVERAGDVRAGTGEIAELYRKYSGEVEARTAAERLQKQIKAGEELLSWARRLGESGRNYGLHTGFLLDPVDRIEIIKRQIENLRQQQQSL
jgi:hypothetical protein